MYELCYMKFEYMNYIELCFEAVLFEGCIVCGLYGMKIRLYEGCVICGNVLEDIWVCYLDGSCL